MEDFALEQPGHRLQPDVRMRRDVHWFTAFERQRTVAVEKTPRPDEPPLPHGQRAPDVELPEARFVGGMGFESGHVGYYERRSIMNRTISLLLLAALCAFAPVPSALAQSCPSISWTLHQTLTATGNTAWLRDLKPVDYDGDGAMDLLGAMTRGDASAYIYTMRNLGGGTFAAPVAIGTLAGRDHELADLNNDGRKDLILPDADNGSIVVRLGNGNGFAAATQFATGLVGFEIELAHMNGDAFLDLIMAGSNATRIYRGVGNGTFVLLREVPTGVNFPMAFVAADFDGDGRIDLAQTDRGTTTTISVLFQNADGSFTTPLVMESVDFTSELRAGDLDGDGRKDLIGTSWELTLQPTMSVMVFRSMANRTFVRTTLLAGIPHTNGSYDALEVADVSGDGALDIVAGSTNNSHLMTFTGMGNGAFRSPTYMPAEYYSALALADFDADGDLDLATTGLDKLFIAKNTCATQAWLYTRSPVISVGQTAPLRALVSGMSTQVPLPRGTVTFKKGDTILGTVDVDANGFAALDAAGLTATGNHTLTAEFSGNAHVPAATSQSIVQKVISGTSTTTINGPLTADAGSPWRGTISVTGAVQAQPTGWVDLTVDGVLRDVYSGAPLVLDLLPGQHAMTAHFQGTIFDPPSTSPIKYVTIAKGTPALTRGTYATTVRLGTAHAIPYTVTNSATGAFTPTGSIQLLRGGVQVGSGALNASGATTITVTLPRGTHEVSAVYSGDARYNTVSQTFSLTVVAAQPLVIDASGLAGGSVRVRAAIPDTATETTLFRRVAGSGGWSAVSSAARATEWLDATAIAGELYEYRVDALVSGGLQSSNIDAAIVFSDDTVSAGMLVRRRHFDELRLAVNAMRGVAGLAPFAFDETYADSAIRASHLASLRSALAEARSALGMYAASYTDAASVGTAVRAVHVQELRDLSR